MKTHDIRTPATHAGDPATAHQAEADHTSSGRRKRNAEIVHYLVCRFPGKTAKELARLSEEHFMACGGTLDRWDIQRRLSDMTGIHVYKGAARECSASTSRRKAVTWWPGSGK